MYEHGRLKPVKVILRRVRGKSENNGENETDQGTLYAYMGIPQKNPM
jgi:hypothetical protein